MLEIDNNITTNRTLNNIRKVLKTTLKNKYNIEDEDKIEKILEIHGLTKNRFDFIKSIENTIVNQLNDISIDANSNKNEKTVEGIIQEAINPAKKAIGYDFLYRQMKELYGKPEAKRLTGELYDFSLGLSDSTNILKPYSYYKYTPLIIKIDNKIEHTNFKKLFDRFESFKVDKTDMEEILTKDIKNEITINHAIIKKEVQKATKCENKSPITEDVNIEIWDNNRWVKISRIIRHKKDTDMMIYQTENGDYAFVTLNHPVILSDKSEKNAGDLCIGDEILKDDILPSFSENVNIPERLAYILGFLSGDGNIEGYELTDEYINDPSGCIKFTRGGNTITVYQKDIDSSNIFSILKEEFPNANFWKCSEKSDRTVNFNSQWFSRMCTEYFGFGYKDNSFSKTLPKNIFNWKRESKIAYICGLIDSDGTVFKTDGRIDIRMRSYSICESLYDILRILGVNGIRKRITTEIMFGISFRPLQEMRKWSEKLIKLNDEVFNKAITYSIEQSSVSKSNKILKIIKDIPDCFNNHIDYVYDITTESGTFYANGMKQHNCWSLDASKLVTIGREFGQLHSKPCKRISSYISALSESIHQLSSHLAGAIAVGSFFFDIAHLSLYSEKIDLRELKTNTTYRKRLENEFQQFVHSVNHLSRSGVESPFTNISIFDSIKLRTLLKDMKWYFINEDLPIVHPIFENDDEREEFYTKYIIDYIIEIQNIYLDFFDKGDPAKGGMPYRFPVQTLNISKKKWGDKEIIEDTEFLKSVCKREIFRYNIFTSEGTKVASCCFDENQEILVRFSTLKPVLIKIKDLYKISRKEGNNPKIFHNGSWQIFKRVKIKYPEKYIKITTSNNKVITVTKDHINPTMRGDVIADNLTTDDYLLFSSIPIDSVKEQDKHLTYEQGYLIGAYLGDGSGAHTTYSTSLSLNKNCYDEIKTNVDIALSQLNINNEMICGNIKNNVYPAVIHSIECNRFIQKWVTGNKANTKRLNLECLTQSIEFRKGIIDGFYATDGGNSNRIYSISEKLIKEIEAVFASLGIQTVIDVSDRTDEKVIIREKEYNRNFPLYCIRWYSNKNKRSMKDVYKIFNNSIYFKIKNIEFVEGSEYAYCVEMRNKEEPYFTLPTGIITHNCRLINNAELMNMASQVNSFGGGGSISMGSHRVVTINFNRIALESSTLDQYYNILGNRLEDATKVLKAHKELIKNLTKKGLQMFISNGWINMNRMFSTVGLLGIYEAAIMLSSKFGKNDYYKDILIFVDNKIKDLATKYGLVMNSEQIPAESYAIRLCETDKLLYGEELVPYKLYANQFVPLWEDATVWEKMDVDGRLNKLITGGGIVHISINEKVTPKQAEKLIKYAVNSGCEHFALNSVWSQCENNHASFGKNEICPECGGKVVDYMTRIVGFMTPVSSWTKVRREWEFPNRKFTKMPQE